jgi:hypothetical protein
MISFVTLIVVIGIILIVLMTFFLLLRPNFVSRSGSHFMNTLTRQKAVLIDRESFGAGEVLWADMQGPDRCSFHVRKLSGGDFQTRAYSRDELGAFDIFQAICDDKPAEFTTLKTKAQLGGNAQEVEYLEQIRRLSEESDSWESKYKQLEADLEHKKEEMVNKQIELSKANKPISKGFGGGR